LEFAAIDAPPFFGAWCVSPNSGMPTFVCLWPNILYAPGTSTNIAVWLGHRSRIAKTWVEDDGPGEEMPEEPGDTSRGAGPGLLSSRRYSASTLTLGTPILIRLWVRFITSNSCFCGWSCLVWMSWSMWASSMSSSASVRVTSAVMAAPPRPGARGLVAGTRVALSRPSCRCRRDRQRR
jgi:hypothetical protein